MPIPAPLRHMAGALRSGKEQHSRQPARPSAPQPLRFHHKSSRFLGCRRRTYPQFKLNHSLVGTAALARPAADDAMVEGARRQIMLKDFAISILRTLHDQGYQAYLVGGCVRDLLLGREPGDYDIATDVTPEQVMRIFPQTYAVGAQFGVVLVPMAVDPSVTSVVDQADVNHGRHRGKTVEVATFRSDIGYSDGRHPDQVRFSKDPRQDVQRRDFTINGLLL